MASSRNQHERDPVEEATSRAEKRNESQHSIPKGAKREKETDRFRCACSDDDASKKKTGEVSQAIAAGIVEGKCYVPPASTAASAAAVGT